MVFGVVDLEEEDVYCGGSGGAICVVWCLVWWILKIKICGVMGQGSLGCTADDDLNTMLPKFLLLFPK